MAASEERADDHREADLGSLEKKASSLLDRLSRKEPLDEEWPEIEDLPPKPLDGLFADWDDDVAPEKVESAGDSLKADPNGSPLHEH